MKIALLKSFEKDFQKLPREIQHQALKKLTYLKSYMGHPSLRTKKIKGYEYIWEGSINMSYRFTYHFEGDTLYLRRIGTHSILGTP